MLNFNLEINANIRIFYNHMTSHKSENTSLDTLLSLKEKRLRHYVGNGRKVSIYLGLPVECLKVKFELFLHMSTRVEMLLVGFQKEKMIFRIFFVTWKIDNQSMTYKCTYLTLERSFNG